MVQIFFSLLIISYVFPLHGLISAKLRFPIKIASTEALSCLSVAKRALPAAEFPAELQMGASAPGLLCARGCRPRCVARARCLSPDPGKPGMAANAPTSTHGQLLQAPTRRFPFPLRFCTPISRVCTHALSLSHTPTDALATTHTLFHTQTFFLPLTQAETSFWIFPLQRSPRSPQHRPGPLLPCLWGCCAPDFEGHHSMAGAFCSPFYFCLFLQMLGTKQGQPRRSAGAEEHPFK